MCTTGFVSVEERISICILFNEMNNLEVLPVNAILISPKQWLTNSNLAN